jgi:hypothetical protein
MELYDKDVKYFNKTYNWTPIEKWTNSEVGEIQK